MLSLKRIIIYGDTIFLSGIAEILRLDSELDVTELSLKGGDMPLKNSYPDMVLVDASQISLDQIAVLMSYFPSNPGLPFISLNVEAKQLIVLSSRQYPAVNLPDLTNVIRKFL